MRSLLLALSFAWLPALEAGEAHSHALHAHEHGVARLNLALEAGRLELELETPAANLLGFEHQPRTPKEQQQAKAVKAALEAPLSLFALPSAAACTLSSLEVEGDVLEAKTSPVAAKDPDEAHAELHAVYSLSCQHPEQLKSLSLAPFFQRFPETRQLLVQLIGPQGQKGLTVTPSRTELSF